LKRAGLLGRGLNGPHSLRRTFATDYEGQERDLQALLGHKDLATTLLYRRSRDDRTRAAVEALCYDLQDTSKTHGSKKASG
ncbi:MAG: tyrosine-type recombinase/integrase, partial [Planctomycetota bacterium]